MPKFGWCRFAEDKYGRYARYHNLKFKMFSTIPNGMEVRRTLRKAKGDTSQAVTYRIRRGNGFYGSVAGKQYQDKYKYPPVTGLENNIPAVWKEKFAAAVAGWQALSPSEKVILQTQGTYIHPVLPGYNLFIRNYMKGS